MTTKFSEVFSLFLTQVDDGELSIVDADEMDYVLEKYLANSIPELEESMLDLESVSFENKDFGVTFSHNEKSIIAKSMKLEWLRTKLNSAELMVKSIGDRDFNSVQGFNYLREIGEIERDLKKDIRDYAIKHSYREEYLDWLVQ